MKIKEIEFIPLRVPRLYGNKWRTALGVKAFANVVIVIVRSEGEAFGIGEVSSIWNAGSTALVHYAGETIRNALIGHDIFDITLLNKKMDESMGWGQELYCLKAGIEMAAYDLIGKEKKMPVYQLLGGKFRDKVPVSRSIGIGSLEERLEQIAFYYAEGYRTIKLKFDETDPDCIRTIEEVRRIYGDALAVRLDANMALYDAKKILNLTERMRELEVISLEQPVHPRYKENLRFLRKYSKIPIMLDESVWSAFDAFDAIKEGLGDIFNVYVSESGGLYNAKLISDLCALAGIGFCIGSMPELGVGTAAARHLAMASPIISQPCDLVGNTYFVDDVINEKLPIEEGFAIAPSGYGLGVTLNFEKIDQFRTDKQ